MSLHPTESSLPPQAWWAFGHVWMVLAGPAIVVVASFVTFYLAVKWPDPVLSTEPHAQTGRATGQGATLEPAMHARNHVATGALSGKDARTQP